MQAAGAPATCEGRSIEPRLQESKDCTAAVATSAALRESGGGLISIQYGASRLGLQVYWHLLLTMAVVEQSTRHDHCADHLVLFPSCCAALCAACMDSEQALLLLRWGNPLSSSAWHSG